MPNHCSSSNKSVYKLLWYCCTCNALRVLRFASQFVMLLAVPPHSSRQLLCPSRHFVHYFLRYASLHHVRSKTICFKAGHPILLTQNNTWECTSLSQANATILTGFHSASLRHSFTSVAFSPPAAHYLARLLSPFRLRSLSAALITMPDTWLIRPSFRHAALSSLASFRRLRALTGNILRRLHMELASASFVGLYCQPLMGARRHVRSFLPPVPYGGSPPTLQCGQVCRTAMLLFLPQALLPAGLTHCQCF